ncbi:hypothetical protein [[Mycobacterium] holstebronense]|uniref:Uncharacterized protein n=1 Tax=[Mycobacterium] holstebronense TaxID=3064288 RepID=A0ABM9LZB0_9MYCO|nr:hypothetical protein [Mycolicibacter sp. MU0102]CAJ1507306.1 hypothetical protein MU0102_003028 [Mycolicibacter sp. MU0102]
MTPVHGGISGTCVSLPAQDLQIRVINATAGQVLPDFTLDLTRDY